jgi:hypothetical protein
MEIANRRLAPRVGGKQGEYASFPGGVAAIRDLSLGGVLLADREPLPVGSPVRMELHLGVEVISCAGVVTRSEVDLGMAVEFLELSPIARSRLGAHLLQADVAEGRRQLSRKTRVAARDLTPRPAEPGVQHRPPSIPNAPYHLGELLLQHGRITSDQLAAVKAQHRIDGGPLLHLLIRLRVVSEEDLVSLFHDVLRLPVIDLKTVEPTPEALRLVSADVVRRHEILPISVAGSTLTIATSDPSNVDALNAVKFLTGCDLKIAIAPMSALREVIGWFYSQRARDAS